MAEPALDAPTESTPATRDEDSASGEPAVEQPAYAPSALSAPAAESPQRDLGPDAAPSAAAGSLTGTATPEEQPTEATTAHPPSTPDDHPAQGPGEPQAGPAPDTADPATTSSAPADRDVVPSAGETPPPTPAVRAPYASVHADTNHGTLIGQLFEAVQRHSGAPLPDAWVQRELANYLPVGNEKDLAALLEEHRVLVLTADHLGSGRWTTALRLLTTVPGESLTVRRIRRDPGDSFSTEGLKGKKHTGWILDLRDTAENIPAACDFGLELCHHDDLLADGSYLIVIAGTDLWERTGLGAGHLARTPKPPEPADLFTHYLHSAGIDNPRSWADDHRLRQGLSHLRPGQVADWARTLVQAEAQYRAATGRGTQPGSDGFDKVITTLTRAASGWMDVLTDWHSEPGRTSYDRNYLLLAAVYDGAAIDNVHEKIASLAVAFKEKEEGSARPTGQQGPGLIQLARQIDAEPLPDGTLRFAGPAYAEAVVRYFWRDRPELTEAFTKWTARLCLELKPTPRTQLAQRMAPWILHHTQAARSTRLLRLVADDWAQDDILAQHTHDILVAAILDPQIGQLARNATNRWADNDDSSPRLLRTLAKVYQTLTPVNPEQMLRRLGGLALSSARSAKEEVAEAVGEAIDVLWSNDKLRPQVRETLGLWFASDNQGLQHSASSAFLHLALQKDPSGAPALLAADETAVPDWVVRGWRTALESDQPSPLAHRASSAWLDTAASLPDTTEQITTTLARAVHDTAGDRLRGLRFLNLVRLAERWLIQTQPSRQEHCNKIHTVLMQQTQSADPRRLPGPRDHEPAGE
ncbi:hypothetical protein ABZ725_50340 [Streptomyces sp. NPDC006872]|uniref:hypothetical protein n=1 Tax=Streptomyces sp. NPDC006872 TaxID=3155720 RepID=UPI0033CC9B97